MIYILIIFLFLGLSYVYDYRGKERNRTFWWMVMLVLLICVAGFRYQMGQDSIRYEKYFAETPVISHLSLSDFKNTRFAPLYIILSSICRTITPEFMLLQFVEAITINCIIFMFIKRHTHHIFFCGLLYFFFLYVVLNMQVLREAFAVGIFLLSWPYMESRQWLKYYALCVVAFFFHVSALALFLLPLIFVPGIRELFVFGKRTWIILPVLIAVSFLIKIYFFDFIKLIALTETMAERANVYSKDDMGGNMLNLMGVAGLLFRYVLYPLIALYFIKRNAAASGEGRREVTAFERVTMAGLYVVALSVGVMIFIRYINYFEIFALITIANWAFTSFRSNGRAVVLNFAYWIIITVPLLSAQFYLEYMQSFNKTNTVKYLDMFWPYSNQIDREIAPNRKKAIEMILRKF